MVMDESGPKSKRTTAAGVVIIGLLIAANLWLGYETFLASPAETGQKGFGPREITAFVFGGEEEVSWQEARTILILGQAGEGNAAPELTDTIMLLYIDPRTQPPITKLISIPRDLLVPLDNTTTKINAVWVHAGNEIRTLIETITGLTISNLVVFNLETVKKVVSEIGGVSVNIPKDIYDPRFPAGPGRYETYEIKAGTRYLNGEEAIKFIRTRSSAGGDFDRIQRQQELFKAIKGKVASLNPLWNFQTLWSIFSIVRQEVITDLTLEDARNLWQVGKKVPFDSIEVMSIDEASGLVAPRTILLGGQEAYVLVPRTGVGEYDKIKEAVQEFITNEFITN